MMALCPEAVDMSHIDDRRQWYVKSAGAATAEAGNRARDLILAHMRDVLGLPAKS